MRRENIGRFVCEVGWEAENCEKNFEFEHLLMVVNGDDGEAELEFAKIW